MAKRRKPISPLAHRIARVTNTFLLLLVLAFSIWRINLYIKSQIAAIHAAGLPASPAELGAWLPQVPDTNNGALLLTDAFTNLHRFNGRSPTLEELTGLTRRDVWSAELRAAAEHYVNTNKEALGQMEAALRLPAFRFPVDHSYGAQTELPHLASLKQSAVLLQLQSMLQSSDANPSWTNALFLQTRLASTLDSDPYMISYLVRRAIIRIAAHSAEYALSRAAPDLPTCRALQKAFADFSQTNLLPQTFIAERAMMIPYFRMSRSEFEATSDDSGNEPRARVKPSGKSFLPNYVHGFFERDLSFYLMSMENVIGASESDMPYLVSRELNAALSAAHRGKYIFSGMFFSSYARIGERELTSRATSLLAATAFAIESYRLIHNQLPETLDALKPEFLPEVPSDPFDGKPIRYRRLSRGYLLYSVDLDRKDDGGKEPPPKKKFKDPITYDLTFTVER
jgi:hypothetical protein